MNDSLDSCGLTDRGAFRRENQDALLLRPEQGVWVVADGMGGHDRGALASQRVVDAFDRMSFGGCLHARVRAAQASIRSANDQLYTESRAGGAASIMGSTVAALVVTDRAFAALWAGDSRVYLFRRGVLKQLTRDHNLAQRLVQEGRLSPAQARHHAAASRITRAVGVAPEVAVDLVRGHLEDDDLLLLCSDGLTAAVEDLELATVMNDCGPQEAVPELMALALERQPRDNVTLLAVAVGASSRRVAVGGRGF